MATYLFEICSGNETEIIESNKNIFTHAEFNKLLSSKIPNLLPPTYDIVVGQIKWNTSSTLTLDDGAVINIESTHKPA